MALNLQEEQLPQPPPPHPSGCCSSVWPAQGQGQLPPRSPEMINLFSIPGRVWFVEAGGSCGYVNAVWVVSAL